ncbi:MAG: outer membrane protein TolC, partial [Flammeovirgaceae bacterium]
MNKFFMVFLLLFCAEMARAQEVETFSLSDVILLARGQSPSSKQAETRLENRYWQYRLYKSNYNPQLALRGNIPGYNRDFL